MVIQNRGVRGADTLQMKVVKAVMRDTENRERRKEAGESTPFDRSAEKAISKAKELIELPADHEDIRELMLAKICENLEKAIPWEYLGETYLGRRAFYEYRFAFVRIVAGEMGMARQDSKKKKRVINKRS